MKYLTSIIVILLLTFSCKKPAEVDLCANGFKDIGETGVDCGGPCEACPIVYLPNLYLRVNGAALTFDNKSFTQLNGDWFLNCFNDSIQLQFNFGSDISTGQGTMQSTNNAATYNGVSYSLITESDFGIQSNNTATNRISGFFGVKFYHVGQIDTLIIEDGAFQDLIY